MVDRPEYTTKIRGTIKNVEAYNDSIGTTIVLEPEIKAALARYKELSNDFYYGRNKHAVDGKSANRAAAKDHHHQLETKIFEYFVSISMPFIVS